MTNGNNKKTYWKDILFQTSGNTIAQLIGILGMPLLTRLYTPEIFAIQAVFVQVVIFLTAFISFRMEYFIPLASDTSEALILSKWVLSVGFYATTISTVIMYLLTITGGFQYFNISMEAVFYLAPITAYVICLSLTFQHEAQRQGAFKATAVAEVKSKLSYITFGAMLSFFTVSVGLILTTILGAAGKIMSLHTYVKYFCCNIKNVSVDKNIVSKYKGRARGMVLSNTLLTMCGLLPILFIGKQYDPNTLGQYSLVISTVFLPSGLIGSAVGHVFYQRAAILWNEKDFIGLKILWRETLMKLSIIAIPIYLFIYFLSPWAYVFFFGGEWGQAGEFAQLMSLAAFFSFLAGPLDRLSLVLGVGYYLPLIHLSRLLLIVFIILTASTSDFTVVNFILMFSVGMSLVYVVDIFSCRIYMARIQMQYVKL